MSLCAQPRNLLACVLGLPPKENHVLKVTRLENLGGRTHFGRRPQEMMTVYRVAVHYQCIVCGQARIAEETRLHPIEEQEGGAS